MEYLKIFITIIVISSAIAIIQKTRIEKTIPITIILMPLIVYISGICGNLFIGIIMIKIVFTLSLFLLIYKIIIGIKKKEMSKITKNIFIFINSIFFLD